MAIRKVVGSPKKSYLDSAKCDASSKPGVGNYNIRVLVIIFREDHKLRPVFQNSRPNLKIGEKSTLKTIKRREPKPPILPPIHLNPQTTPSSPQCGSVNQKTGSAR